MEIDCGHCGKAFHIPTENWDNQGLNSSCPHCRTAFRVLPRDENGRHEVIFYAKKKTTRVCIQCSREFQADDLREVVPICPSCRQETSPPPKTEASRVWKLLREGQLLEIASEVVVKEMILKGEIGPDDRLISPGGMRASAKRYAQFRDAFSSRAEGKRRSMVSSSSSSYRPVRRRRRQLFFELIGLLALALPLGWIFYRVSSLGSVPQWDASIEHLVMEFRAQHPSPEAPLEELLKVSEEFLRRHSLASLAEARRMSESALVVGPGHAKALGTLARVYGASTQFEKSTELGLKAQEIVEAGIRLYPKSVDGYLGKVRVSLASEDPATASTAMTQALKLDPSNPHTLLTHSLFLLQQSKDPNDFEAVVSSAARALNGNPDLLEGYDLIGQAYFQKGEPVRALASFRQRLSLAPLDSLALLRVGLIELRASRFKEAVARFQQCLREEPRQSQARFQLAQIYEHHLGKFTLAERHYRDILTRYRNHSAMDIRVLAQKELVTILLKTNRAKDALNMASTFPIFEPKEGEITLAKARALTANKEKKKAISLLRNYLEKKPQDGAAALQLARYLGKGWKAQEAIRWYRAAIEAQPDDLDSYLFLVDLLVQKKEFDQALDVANAAVTRTRILEEEDLGQTFEKPVADKELAALTPSFERLREHQKDSAVPNALEGLFHLRQGLSNSKPKEIRSALSLLAAARDLAPSEGQVVMYQGRAFYELKNWKRAALSFQKAVKINPASGMAHFWLGSSYLRQKKFKAAQKSFGRAVRDNNASFRAMTKFGDLAYRNGDATKAIDWWRKALAHEKRYVPAWRSLLAHGKS